MYQINIFKSFKNRILIKWIIEVKINIENYLV